MTIGSAASALVDRRAQRAGLPRLEHEREVEGELKLVRAQVRRDALLIGEDDLADEHAVARIGVRERDASRDRCRAPPAGRSRSASRRRSARRGTAPARRRAIASLTRPCATSMRKPSTPRSSQKRRIASKSPRTCVFVPVEVGLLRREQVEVVLVAGLVERPRRPAPVRRPVVRQPVRGRRGDVARAVAREPRMLARGVVRDDVDDRRGGRARAPPRRASSKSSSVPKSGSTST